MKNINSVLIVLCMLCISWGVQAHQPDLSSTMLVEQGENKWVLQVRAALTAFEYEVEQHYGAAAYATPEEFQELVVEHVQEHVSVLFNEDNAVILQNGKVKLGHETSITFEVVGAPDAIQSLVVENSSFSDISRNQSVLMIIKEGFSKDQFMLTNNNEHTAKLKVSDIEFELVTPTEKKASYFLLVFAGVLLVLSIIYIAYKKQQSLGNRGLSPKKYATSLRSF